jgi:hypothetical protein
MLNVVGVVSVFIINFAADVGTASSAGTFSASNNAIRGTFVSTGDWVCVANVISTAGSMTGFDVIQAGGFVGDFTSRSAASYSGTLAWGLNASCIDHTVTTTSATAAPASTSTTTAAGRAARRTRTRTAFVGAPPPRAPPRVLPRQATIVGGALVLTVVPSAASVFRALGTSAAMLSCAGSAEAIADGAVPPPSAVEWDSNMFAIKISALGGDFATHGGAVVSATSCFT